MAISRKAILIGAPSVKPVLPGVITDINDIKEYLLSNVGGAWRSNEIVTMIDPSSTDVYRQMELARNIDYVFITCSGHGEHIVGKGIDETVMYLNEKEKISISSINPANKRHLIIADVCRNLVLLHKDEMREMIKAAVEHVKKMDIDYRKIFDDHVMLNPEGRIVAYSCSINQSAGDDGTGGVFTQELLKAHSNFSPTNNRVGYGIVKIDQAFEKAKEMTYKRNAPQTPVFNAGRRMTFYPFAIVQ